MHVRRVKHVAGLLFCLASLRLLPAQQPQLQTRSSDSRSVTLDVIVRTKAGAPPPGLTAKDFTLFDNKQPVPPASLTLLPSDTQSAQIIFVIDAINASLPQVVLTEAAIEKYLRAQGPRLTHPASILIVSDSEPPAKSQPSDTTALHHRQLFVHRIPASLDPAILIQALTAYKPGLHRILDAQGATASSERVRLSLEALSFIATAQSTVASPKLVLWIGPGWPYLSQSNAKSSQQLFDSVVFFSDLIRSARLILYSISPEGVTAQDNSARTENFLLNTRPGSIQANGHTANVPIELGDTYYANFLHSPATPDQSNPNQLALQVLAIQSGGLVLQHNNDLKAQITQSISDADTLYSLAYTPPPAEATTRLHELRITLSQPTQPPRTRASFYIR